MSISIEQNPLPWTIYCNPYQSQGNCSSKEYRLEPGTEYQITAKLTKVLLNYSAEKTGRCTIKTSKGNSFHENTIRLLRS
jgi:hypothetical protein